jgi:hypothetical protein
LNENTQKVVGLLKEINEGIIFSYPITGIRDSNATVSAFIDLEKLGNEPFADFGIMKFKELFDLLNIAGKDADCSLSSNGIINIDSDTIKCRYITTNLIALEDFRPKISILEKFEMASQVARFTLTNVDLDKIKKVSSLLAFEDFVLNVDNNETVVISVKNKQASSNSFSLKIPSENNFSDVFVLMGVSHIKKLPPSDYVVRLAKHPVVEDNFLVKFESSSIEGLHIFMATKAYQKG